MAKKELPLKKFQFIVVLLLLIILFLLLGYNISRGYINKTSFEKSILSIASKNEQTLFTIDNVVLFSSCNADATINKNTNLNISNLYQYTDIAIFITPNGDELTLSNTLKEVQIDNINLKTSPSYGTPKLYYKNINNFATPDYSKENALDNSFTFNITSENEADLNTPTLYNNCANPITLTYVNDSIKTDYTLEGANSQITYDGSLLKKCGVPLSSISCGLEFDIHIVNNLDQQFICPIYLQIPLELDDGSSIYDGKILLKKQTNYTFYRYN